ncbi:MAG: hypothetical protein II793_02515 [Bacteroidales bacterium]|nr:hypothetical protein [Bacteroidales bacterium]
MSKCNKLTKKSLSVSVDSKPKESTKKKTQIGKMVISNSDESEEVFPSDYQALLERAEQKSGLEERMEFWLRAMDYFVTGDEEMRVKCMNNVRQLHLKMRDAIEVNKESQMLLEEYSKIKQWRNGVRMPTMGMTDADAGRFVLNSKVEANAVRSLQNALIKAGLLDVAEDCEQKDPLLAILGAKGHSAEEVEPMVWMGKVNQLHYLIDTLYARRVIKCADDKKWCVAAQMFVNRRTGKLFTSRSLTKASAIKKYDIDVVEACIPWNLFGAA